LDPRNWNESSRKGRPLTLMNGAYMVHGNNMGIGAGQGRTVQGIAILDEPFL
jgi:hypothetical protein